MSGKLDGKVALTTGGGTGIGLATAREFAREGAEVYITGRRKRELDAAAASVGTAVTAIEGDVTKPADLDRIYAQIGREHGRVDIVSPVPGTWLPSARSPRSTSTRSSAPTSRAWCSPRRRPCP